MTELAPAAPADLADPKGGGLKQDQHSPSGFFAVFAVRFRASPTRPAQKQKPPLLRRLC